MRTAVVDPDVPTSMISERERATKSPEVVMVAPTQPALPAWIFQFVFSNPVTGVDAADFVLSTSSISGANVTSVTGSATTYTVSVNTGSGSEQCASI